MISLEFLEKSLQKSRLYISLWGPKTQFISKYIIFYGLKLYILYNKLYTFLHSRTTVSIFYM